MEVLSVSKRPVKKFRHRPYAQTETPPALKEIKEKYAGHRPKMSEVEKDVILQVLDVYASDIHTDLYNIADAFNVPYPTLGDTLRSNKYRAYYNAAKAKRAAAMTSRMLNVASEPFKKFTRGEEVSFGFIKSVDLYAKYLAFVAQKTDPELQEQNAGNNTLMVNTVVKIRDLSHPEALVRPVIEAESEAVEDEADDE